MKTRHLLFIPILGIVFGLFTKDRLPWVDSRYPVLSFFGSAAVQLVSTIALISLFTN